MLVAPGCAGQALDEPEQDEQGETNAEQAEPGSQAPLIFGVYALSRGSGVPDEAREAMQAVVAVVAEDAKNEIAVRTERTRLGIEGETRLCIEYQDQDSAAAAFQRIQEIVEGVDLMNLVAEACMKAPEPEPETESEPE